MGAPREDGLFGLCRRYHPEVPPILAGGHFPRAKPNPQRRDFLISASDRRCRADDQDFVVVSGIQCLRIRDGGPADPGLNPSRFGLEALKGADFATKHLSAQLFLNKMGKKVRLCQISPFHIHIIGANNDIFRIFALCSFGHEGEKGGLRKTCSLFDLR